MRRFDPWQASCIGCSLLSLTLDIPLTVQETWRIYCLARLADLWIEWFHHTCCKLGRDATSQYKHGCARLVADNHLENVDIVTDELQLSTLACCYSHYWSIVYHSVEVSSDFAGVILRIPVTCSIGAAVGKESCELEVQIWWTEKRTHYLTYLLLDRGAHRTFFPGPVEPSYFCHRKRGRRKLETEIFWGLIDFCTSVRCRKIACNTKEYVPGESGCWYSYHVPEWLMNSLDVI
jgi:hypothetical protein